MGILKRNQPDDVLFLQPVRFADEKLHRGKVRMLYCDASGKVYSSIINRTVYERARDNAAIMAQSRKPFATIGLETGPGRFIPVTIEIGDQETWALERILEHALKNGKLPDILKKYLRPMTRLVESDRQFFISEYRKRRRGAPTGVTPRILERLPYYREQDMEVSMPIYKAELIYPLIVLKPLPTGERPPHNTRSLLILDSDGDIAVIKVPAGLVRKIEMEMAEQIGKKRGSTCTLISQNAEGYVLSYMSISRQQKQSLEVLTRYFEETGSSKQRVSLLVKTLLARAKDRVSSPAS